MDSLIQKVKMPSRNTKVTIVSDYPSFDVLVNGEYYETYPQNHKNYAYGNGTNRSIRTARKIQNTNALQRVIRDNLYRKIQRL